MAESLIKAQFSGNLDYGNYQYYINLSDDDLFNNARDHLFPEELNYKNEIMAMVNDRGIWITDGRLRNWLYALEFDPKVQMQYHQIKQFHEQVQAQFKLLKQKHALQHMYKSQPLNCSLAAAYLIWTTPVVWWLLKGLVKWQSLNTLSLSGGVLLLLVLCLLIIDAIFAVAWAWPTLADGFWQSFKDLYVGIYNTKSLQKFRKRLKPANYYLDGKQIKRM